MPVKKVSVTLDHTFYLDIPENLLTDEDGWDLSDFVYSAFMDNEDNWDTVDIDIKEKI